MNNQKFIIFPGHLGGFGFVYIWDEIHVVIGSMEGEMIGSIEEVIRLKKMR